MNKLSKLLVMAIVVLAVVTMSLNVKAGTMDLVSYIKTAHSVNGMTYELKGGDKVAVEDYIVNNLSDAQSDAALAKIKEAEALVASTGAKKAEDIPADVKSKVISLATTTASEVGLTLKVDTANNTYSLSNGAKVLSSGKIATTTVGGGAPAGGSSNGGSSAPAGNTLLYTGANYAVCGALVLAIVAVAVVVKKRA